jgi:hypothetical protein
MLIHTPLKMGRWAMSACLFAGLGAGVALAQTPAAAGAESAAALHEKYRTLGPQLEKNQFQRPLVMDSVESAKAVSGSAYALIDYPYATVLAAFRDPENWCEVLILHLNTKHCRTDRTRQPPGLTVSFGKKTPQELRDVHALSFSFTPARVQPEHMVVTLNAAKGPMGTHNYRIDLEAVPLGDKQTFMHLRYAYGYGMAGRMAMQTYMATVGSSKVGFSEVAGAKGGPRVPVGGLRGAVERNTMRYYLAIDAYLASLALPAPQQFEKRLQHWFDATERFPRQLHEIDKEEYLSMKRSEYGRQQSSP